MTQPAFEHPLLRVPTPAAWAECASESRELLLLDHANCEKKAASTALALMFAYAEDLELADKMSRLAREELRHYEQVAKLIKALGIAPQFHLAELHPESVRVAMPPVCAVWSRRRSRSERSI